MKKEKKTIHISINKDIIEKLNELSTNKSRFIEYALIEYLKANNIDIKNILL